MAQQPGTAPGPDLPASATRSIYAVPGVPYEMKEMVEGTVLPDLARRAGVQAGDPQPHAAHVGPLRVGPRRDAGRPHRRARRAGQPHHRLPGQRHRGPEGAHHGQGRRRRRGRGDPRRRGGACCCRSSATSCSARDDETMEAVVLDLLRERGLTLAVAESVTGGLVDRPADRRPGGLATSSGAGSCPTPREVKFDVLGRARGPGGQPGGGRRRWPRACAGCSGADVGLGGHRRGRPRPAGGPARGHRATSGCALGDEVEAVTAAAAR